MLRIRRAKQGGVTLVELMVGSAVGLIILAAILATYVSVARSASEVLASAKLNAELRAVMDVMVRDIRRAGSWTASPDDREKGDNPFMRRAGSLITDISIYEVKNAADGGRAIQFAYNGSFLGSKAGTVFGYRLEDKAIKTLQCNIETANPGKCNTGTLLTTGWEKLTDENNLVIDALAFWTTGSRCLNLTQAGPPWEIISDHTLPACDPDAPGYVATTKDRLLEQRQIRVFLAGSLKDRKEFRMELKQTVLLANDRVFNVP